MAEEQQREGGWGWLVAMGMALMFIVSTGPMGSFGFLFGEFLESLGVGTKGLTLISSVNFLCFSFTGLLSNYSLRSFSCRQVCLFGSCLFVAGNFLTIFATSVPQMLITYGIIPGVGMGLMVPATFQSFNTYFITRRTFVMSISQAIIGAGCMVYPLLVEELMAHYGFRGAQAIITALCFNTILAAVVMKPIDKEILTEDTPPAIILKADYTVIVHNSQDNAIENISLGKSIPGVDKNNTQQNGAIYLSTEDTKDSAQGDNFDASALKQELQLKENNILCEETDTLIAPGKDYVEVVKTTTQPSIIVMSDIGEPSSSQANESLFRKLFRMVVDFFDLTLLADPVYVNISIGASCAFFADITFFMLHPLMLFNLEFSKGSTALCMAMGAGGDLVGRLFLVGLGLWRPSVSSRQLLWAGALMAVVCRTVFTATSSFVAVSIVTTLLGFFRAWVMVTGPLVFAEYCAERFPSAFGLYMVINGLIAILVGPLIGWIRDVTDSYAISTHSLSALTTVCVVLWAVEWTVLRYFKKKPKS